MSISTTFRTCVIVLVFLLSFVVVMYWLFPTDNKISNIPKHVQIVPRKHSNDTYSGPLRIPNIIHHTWKTGSSPPSETIRWRESCKTLNPSYEFRMYNDDDLAKFVQFSYPQYYPLFQSLKGVCKSYFLFCFVKIILALLDMADMARLLLVYHFGGIYLDLDFYCFRPYSCLEKYARHQALQTMKQLQRKEEVTDLLVVSREPVAHAELFRNKSRVVIQDFFMASPKHPFLKWLLDDRMKHFQSHGVEKGPFSYSIDKDIDRYYAMQGLPPINPMDIYNLPSLDGARVNSRRLESVKTVKTAAVPTKVDAKSSSTTTVAATSAKAAAPVTTASAATLSATTTNSVKFSDKAGVKTTTATATTAAASKPARTEIQGVSKMKLAAGSKVAPDVKKPLLLASTNTSANCTMPTANSTDPPLSTAGSAPATPKTVKVTPSLNPRSASNITSFSFVGSNVTKFSLIIELREDILHPLLDSTNSRLFDHCGKDKIKGLTEGAQKACEAVNKKHFFNPTEDTMLVHMWTHTYLGKILNAF